MYTESELRCSFHLSGARAALVVSHQRAIRRSEYTVSVALMRPAGKEINNTSAELITQTLKVSFSETIGRVLKDESREKRGGDGVSRGSDRAL